MEFSEVCTALLNAEEIQHFHVEYIVDVYMYYSFKEKEFVLAGR